MQPVYLHVYDVGNSQAMSRINHVVRTVGLGAFHGAIEVRFLLSRTPFVGDCI